MKRFGGTSPAQAGAQARSRSVLSASTHSRIPPHHAHAPAAAPRQNSTGCKSTQSGTAAHAPAPAYRRNTPAGADRYLNSRIPGRPRSDETRAGTRRCPTQHPQPQPPQVQPRKCAKPHSQSPPIRLTRSHHLRTTAMRPTSRREITRTTSKRCDSTQQIIPLLESISLTTHTQRRESANDHLTDNNRAPAVTPSLPEPNTAASQWPHRSANGFASGYSQPCANSSAG
jgi:hypothetical protein